MACAGWGLLLGTRRARRFLAESAGAGLAAAALVAAGSVLVTLARASETDPATLWVVLPALTVGGWAVLVAVLVAAAAAGERRARRP